ncbi:MAG TPA: ATP-binding protein [Egibacteraceae bacterium]|nr:ATP-binding protein [Egibacteraceae bacterium]
MGVRRLVFLLIGAGVAAELAAAAWPGARWAVLAVFLAAASLLAWAALQDEQRRRRTEVRRLEDSLERRISELATERHRIERLLERLPIAVLVFAPGGLAYGNPAARALFPAAEEGRSPLRVLTLRALADAVAEARESGRTVHVEVERDERWLSARAVVMAEGEVALVVTDQTEARRVEAVRRDFVVNASHELKTPVATMQVLAETLEMALSRDPATAAGMAQRLRAEAVRMGQLVRDLLDLARMEEQGAERRERVELAGLVAGEVARVATDARALQVEVSADVGDAVSVVAVPEDVRLIVANLLENAVRYNRPGGRVLVRAARAGADVVIEVVDTGIGLAEADRVRVFERFYRVDRARSRDAGGTGLGLALVRHAAERHGGEVSVDSVLGEGSTFRVILPVSAD